MNINLDKKIEFSGSHRGIRFLISCHGIGSKYTPDGTWCYYILINEKQLPEEYKKDFILPADIDDKGRASHDYYGSKVSDLEFHGGITWYSKEGGADGDNVVIKIGCDYAHLFDEGMYYTEDSVLIDVVSTIENLYLSYSDIKIYSNLYGGYFKESEGEYSEHGSFRSFEEKSKWNENHTKII